MTPDSDARLGRSPGTPPVVAHPLFTFPLKVDRFYASLMRHAPSGEAGLGGRLLYAGELGEEASALIVAANIAGSASLAATSEPGAGKQAIRDGVADFLVTTLDEALRILKNQVRKREPVAVCVAAEPATIEQEMLERGVLPDLVRDVELGAATDRGADYGGSAIFIAPLSPAQNESIVTWSVDEAPTKWLPRLDAIALECLAPEESASAPLAHRWLRFAPRYLGRLARNVRVLRCSTLTAHTIAERMHASIDSGKIPITVRIEIVVA
jgi:hypothetical protein